MFSSRKTAAPSTGYNLTKSLRFRSSASAYLNRTFGTPTNNKIFTWSGWIKIGTIPSSREGIFVSTNGALTSYWGLEFNASAGLTLYDINAGGASLVTTQVFRDPSSWYHVVVAIDTTQATASNRAKLYINGTQITSFSTATYPAQNSSPYMNTSGNIGYIGNWSSAGGLYFDGYMAEVNFIDGQALTPSSFGSTNALTGVWQPIKYTGTYGTNGFYLPFTNTASTTTLGYDSSGNSNNWTTNNLSLTAGTTYDSMTDVPTLTSATVANYCVMNPVDQSLCSVTNGNLAVTTNNGGYGGATRGTIGVSSGKWYWETQITTNGGSAGQAPVCGIMSTTTPILQSGWTSYQYYGANGNKQRYTAGTLVTNSAYGATYTTGDVIGVALDMDAGTLTFYKNNTSQGTAFTGITGNFAPSIADPSTGGTTAVNFGQQGFAYTPPTGFVALNTYNLPASTIKNGAAYMAATTYTGNGTTGQNITNTVNGISFQPDFVWIKSRSLATNNALYDSIRGVYVQLQSNGTGAEGNYSPYGLTAFNSNGFGVYDQANGGYNVNGSTGSPTYVGWQWQAGQGSTSSNTNGSITSTVSVNASAGFSVVTYTGNGTANSTVGHGLGVTPSMIITKVRSTTESWAVFHVSLLSLGTGYFLELDGTGGASNGNSRYPTAPTSSVYYVGSVGNLTPVNANGQTYVSYCWAAISGFSAFGSYTGNNSTDGPFVYTGFRPKFILIKDASATGNWVMEDTSRSTYNQTAAALYPNLSNAEDTGNALDILSNGFKIRASGSAINQNSSDTFIYAAFAENPFKNALAR